jgi:hypothetical protein
MKGMRTIVLTFHFVIDSESEKGNSEVPSLARPSKLGQDITREPNSQEPFSFRETLPAPGVITVGAMPMRSGAEQRHDVAGEPRFSVRISFRSRHLVLSITVIRNLRYIPPHTSSADRVSDRFGTFGV